MAPHSSAGPTDVPGAGAVLEAHWALTAFVALLFVLPAPLVVAELGSAGNPAFLMGVAAAFTWCWFRVARGPSAAGPHPVKTAALLFLLLMLIVYAHAMMRAIPSFEVSPADSNLLRLCGLVGILLLAHDGIPSRLAFHRLLRSMAAGTGLLAGLAVIQFLTGQLIVDRISVPGLTWSAPDDATIQGRNGLVRATGTATSPIELAVALGMMLPILLTITLNSRGTRRFWFGAAAGASAFALFLTVSRSGLIVAAVGMGVMFPAWTPAIRRGVAAAGAALLVAVYVTVPGLIATFRALFLGVESDPSAKSRTSGYEYAAQFIARNPILGRGGGTFLPVYRIFDNEYLLFLVEAGVVGLLAWLATILVSVFTARRAALTAMDPFDAQASRAVGAAVAAGASGGLFFDVFAFPIVTGLLFLLMGMCGAAWTLARQERRPQSEAEASGGGAAQL